jgi:hypothetical protein
VAKHPDPTMVSVLLEEQSYLWDDLDKAVCNAQNGIWSVDAGNAASRLIKICRLVGALRPEQVPYRLVASGIYQAVLTVGGVPYREPTDDEWEIYDRVMNLDRHTVEAQFRRTVETIHTACEATYIRDEAVPTDMHRLAPWTDEEVASLRDYQRSGRFHPFTCVDGHGPLTAERMGFRCQQCTFHQPWAFVWMTNDSWRIMGALPPLLVDTGGSTVIA